MGLTVNKYVDERKDFNKSVFAASELLKNYLHPTSLQVYVT